MIIEAIDEQGKKVATGRFGTQTREYKAMLGYVRRQWPQHRWAIEGAQGVGRPLTQRLLADGGTVVDIPARLAARVRVFETGHARKIDATDAHAIAAAALRTPDLASYRGASLQPVRHSGLPRVWLTPDL